MAGFDLSGLTRAFHHRNYRLFFSGQLVSLVGTWLQTVAQSWLVYRLTGSAEMLGLVGFAGQGPVFFLASFGGVVADRFDRHRILVATQGVSMVLALVLATLTLGGWVHEWHVFALACLLGTVNAFDIPTRQAFVVQMVGHDDLPNAIALNSSMFNAARLLGPAAAGVLVAAVGEGWCFLINGLSFVAVIAGLLAMDRDAIAPRPAPKVESVLATLRGGFAFAAGHRRIRALLLMLAVSSLTGVSYVVLMPIFADKILGGGATGQGILMSASGLGALAGALTLASRTGTVGLGRWIGWGALGLGASMLAFAASPYFWSSALLMVAAGFSMMAQMAATNTLVQAMVPDEFRGRIMALYSMMFMGMAPFGALAAGLLAGAVGPRPTVAMGGAVALAAAGWFWRHLARQRG